MEIKLKVSFALSDELMKALNINDDTPVFASISNGRVTVEIVDNDDEDNYTEDDLYDEDDFYDEDDLYDEDDNDECGDGECDCCEYYCHHCGKCVLN